MGWKKRVCQVTDYELLERYAAGERNFAGIELVASGYRTSKHGDSIDLDGVILRDINLRGACFNKVAMIGADLTGGDLGRIFMRDCWLNEGIIRDANLCAANICNNSFYQTDLRGSNLDQISAIGTNFRGAYLRTLEYAVLAEADFREAHTDDGLICRGMNLIWRTTLPSGIIVEGPQWGTGRDAR
jgi:uncharacterized protein YjbI with pentapeptide repeats